MGQNKKWKSLRLILVTVCLLALLPPACGQAEEKAVSASAGYDTKSSADGTEIKNEIFSAAAVPVLAGAAVAGLAAAAVVLIRKARKKEVETSGEEKESCYLAGMDGVMREKIYQVTQKELIIGREAEGCQAVYPPKARGISRYHCKVELSRGKILLTDLDSSYGTFLSDGTRLTPNTPYELKYGDSFYLAGKENTFKLQRTDVFVPNEPKNEPKAVLEVYALGWSVTDKKYKLYPDSSLIFGRDASEANVVFPDIKGTEKISRVHCEIRTAENAPVLIDRDSKWGTWFSDGSRLEPNIRYRLRDGMVFYLAGKDGGFGFAVKFNENNG